jgi:WD40 repeat protein
MKKIFICYSHEDEAWKDSLVNHLNALKLKEHYDVWDDSRIEIGVDWRTKIERALNEAVVAILMVSVNFLNSKFIDENEIPRIIERHEKEGLKVIPLFVKPCPWERVPWLAKFQGIPRNRKTLAEYDESNAVRILADLAKEIYDIENEKKIDSPLQRTAIPMSEKKSIVLKGHKEEVFGVVITPDGTKIVSGSEDETIKVWDLESYKCSATFKIPSAVWGVAVTPDGKITVCGCGSHDNTLRVVDLQNGECFSTLKGHTKSIGPWAVAVMPDGKRAVSGSHDGTIKVWNISSERCIKTIKGHNCEIIGIALTSNGNRVISSSTDSTMKLWDLESLQCLATFEGHTSTVNGVAVTPDGERVVSGSYDRTLKVWDLKSGNCLDTFEGHTGCVYGVVVTPNNKWVVSGSQDKTVKVWDLETGECAITFSGHTDSVNGVAITPDGKRVVSTSKDKTLIVWELPEYLRTREEVPGKGKIQQTKDPPIPHDSSHNKPKSEKIGKAVKRILILSANPITTPRLSLDEEIREIEEGLQRAKHRGQFKIESKFAVRLRDLRRALLDYEPHIVHFSGHGRENGLLLEDETGNAVLIPRKALSGLFELFSNRIECVILCACYSAKQANAISKHINYVIGMRKKIDDKATVEFALGFYDALGAGRSVEEAFKFGCNAVRQVFPYLPEHLIPILKKRKYLKREKI